MISVRDATQHDRAAILGVMIRAFATDPIIRFFFPDDETYPRRSGAFFGYLFDIRIEAGVVTVTDDVTAASLWNPPGGLAIDERALDTHWESAITATGPADEAERFAAFHAMLEAVYPKETHWYLGLLGTDPVYQHGGHATAVLRPVLRRADAGGIPAYLETSKKENLAFYARFGFEIRDEFDAPGGPHLWGLWRLPNA